MNSVRAARRFSFMLLLVAVAGHIYAQALPDQVLPVTEFIQQVKQFHPVVKQAHLIVAMADAETMTARGKFDPALAFDASRKTFAGKNYYYYTNPELKVPLPVGNLYSGIENNGGDFITSEVTKGKTSYLGVELPIANGLLLDKRRAALQQARIYQQQSEQERLNTINELLLSSYLAYWNWAAAYHQFTVFSKFAALADGRLRLVRIAYNQGDRALIDTVEAYTQWQTFQLQQSEALLKMANAKLELSGYLWYKDNQEYLLPDHYIPDTLQFNTGVPYADINVLLDGLPQNPLLRVYDFKLDRLAVEQRLKRQQLLPYVSLKAQLLNKDYYVLKDVGSELLRNNYRWGIDVKIPLFLREARGEYRKSQLKIQDTQLDIVNKRRQTENKIRAYHNELLALAGQLQSANKMVQNYQALLRSEELKFAQGESSLFLINSRESKLSEMLQKRIELAAKWYKSLYSLEWAAGKIK